MAKAINKDKAMRQWQALSYAKQRKEIASLRRKARDARKRRVARLAKAKKACAARRKKADAAADRAFRKALAKARDRQKAATVLRHAKRKARRDEARELCALERRDIEVEAAAAVKLAEDLANAKRAALLEEQSTDRLYWQAHGSRRGKRHRGKSVSAKQRRKERREEQLDEVRHNLQPHELLVFERVKNRLKPKPDMSLTEVFEHYLHDNPDELHAAQIEHAEARLRELQASEYAAWLDKHGAELADDFDEQEHDGQGPSVAHAAWLQDSAFQSPPMEFHDAAVPF